MKSITLYILVSAVVSYAIRVIPLTLFRKPIKSRFIRSFLYYVPYVTIAVMTFPAILEATSNPIAGLCALLVGIGLSFIGKSMFTVACACCGCVLLMEWILTLL